MSTLNLSLTDVAFAVTIMLASFAIEAVLGLVKSAFRLARRALLALTVVVLVGAAAVGAGAVIVSAHGS